MRFFTVVQAKKSNGCLTKHKEGRYKGRAPVDAAKKAFNELCRVKKIRGVCTMVITVRETTQGSDKKLFTYKLMRHKLKEPIVLQGASGEYKIEYKISAKSQKTMKKGRECGKSRGRLARKTSKASHNKSKKSPKSKNHSGGSK